MKHEARNPEKSDLELMFEKMRKRKEEQEALSKEAPESKIKEVTENKEAKENKSNKIKEIKKKYEREEEVKSEKIVKSHSGNKHFQGNDEAIPPVASNIDANGKEEMKFYCRRKGQTLLTEDDDFRLESTRERNSPILKVKMMPNSQSSSRKIPQNDEKMTTF